MERRLRRFESRRKEAALRTRIKVQIKVCGAGEVAFN